MHLAKILCLSLFIAAVCQGFLPHDAFAGRRSNKKEKRQCKPNLVGQDEAIEKSIREIATSKRPILEILRAMFPSGLGPTDSKVLCYGSHETVFGKALPKFVVFKAGAGVENTDVDLLNEQIIKLGLTNSKASFLGRKKFEINSGLGRETDDSTASERVFILIEAPGDEFQRLTNEFLVKARLYNFRWIL